MRDAAGRAQSSLADPAMRTRWHAMLTGVANERGYKPGWIAHKHKEKFGAYPPWGSKPQPIPPTPEVWSWVRSRAIAFARRTGT